mmetsp:Transcript_167355/g.532028  ORF Transcript_167355/g.532028 Transcript_167355/m.532028 type:complete len:226 (-) Transcript_167355:63-740(-)
MRYCFHVVITLLMLAAYAEVFSGSTWLLLYTSPVVRGRVAELHDSLISEPGARKFVFSDGFVAQDLKLTICCIPKCGLGQTLAPIFSDASARLHGVVFAWATGQDWESSDILEHRCADGGLCGVRYDGHAAFGCAIDEFKTMHPGLKIASGAPFLVLRNPASAEEHRRRDFFLGCCVLAVIFFLTFIELGCLRCQQRGVDDLREATAEEKVPLSRSRPDDDSTSD